MMAMEQEQETSLMLVPVVALSFESHFRAQ